MILQSGELPPLSQSVYNYPVRYGYLENVSQDYATQASEAALVVSEDDSKVRLEILKDYEHSDRKIYVAFQEDMSDRLSLLTSQPVPEGEAIIRNVAIKFEVGHSFFNSLMKAINAIPPVIIQRILPSIEWSSLEWSFFPLHELQKEYIESLLAELPEIDNDQYSALCTILACDRKSPPVLVNGSFGTGKTRLLAVATHCLIQHGINNHQPVRVLVCAHHQASADHFIEQYFGPMFADNRDVKLVRLTSMSYEVRNSSYEQVYMKSNTLGDLNLPNYFIVATTFLTAPSLEKFKASFTHILMDEGSQSREPEAIAPLSLAGLDTKIVITGDLNQVSALYIVWHITVAIFPSHACTFHLSNQQVGSGLLVLGEEARENGLKYSLLERLGELYKQYGGLALQHMASLNTNHCCHQELVKVPNEFFYESKIKVAPSNAAEHHLAEYPLVFVCSSLTTEVNLELELLQQVRHFVVDNWPTSWGEKDLKQICIVTPSQTQV